MYERDEWPRRSLRRRAGRTSRGPGSDVMVTRSLISLILSSRRDHCGRCTRLDVGRIVTTAMKLTAVENIGDGLLAWFDVPGMETPVELYQERSTSPESVTGPDGSICVHTAPPGVAGTSPSTPASTGSGVARPFAPTP